MNTSINFNLKSLYLENFKSIIGPTEIKFAPITLFYGPNSAGKTAVYSAIELMRDVCKAVEPASFEDRLRHIARNHDHELDMTFGLSAQFNGLTASTDNPRDAYVTREFAETFPNLVESFFTTNRSHDTPSGDKGEPREHLEIDVRYAINFIPQKESSNRWLCLDRALGDRIGQTGVTLPLSWAIEIRIDSVLLVAMTVDVIYYNLSHPVIQILNKELASSGYDLTSLFSLFWSVEVIDGMLCTGIEHEYRNGRLYFDEDTHLGYFLPNIPFEEARHLYFLLRGIMDFLVTTPIQLIGAAAGGVVHVGPVRRIPVQDELTFQAVDFNVHPILSENNKLNWSDGTFAWHWLVSDFIESAKVGEMLNASYNEMAQQQDKDTGDLLMDANYLSLLGKLKHKDFAWVREYYRKQKDLGYVKKFSGHAIDVVNNWMSSPQRFGLHHRILLTFSGVGTPVTYPSIPVKPNDAPGPFPQFLIAVHLLDDTLSAPVSISEVGAGIPQIVPVLAAGLRAQHSHIEQPELHIHPRLQTEIGDFFLSCWNQMGHYSIVETHSEHIALRLLRRIRESQNAHIKHRDYDLSKNDVAFYYFNRVDGGTEIVHLRVSDDGEFLDRWPRGFFAEREAELFSDDD
jgi:hypothetical protein